MSLADELLGDIEKKEFRLTKNRKKIWDKIFRKVRPVVKYRYGSASKQIDIAGELGARYIDRMVDIYQGRYQEIEEEIQELEQEKQRLKDDWETDEVKFKHLDKFINS